MALDPNQVFFYPGNNPNKGFYSDRMRYYERLQKEKEKEEADRILYEEQELERQQAIENSKSIFQRVGDLASGVANTAWKGTKGAAEFGYHTTAGATELAMAGGELKRNKRIQDDEAKIRKRYSDEIERDVFGGDKSISSVDELPVEKQKKFEEIVARQKAELDVFNKDDNNKKTDMGHVWETQRHREKEFKRSGRDLYQAAQYLPGVSFGAETIGGIVGGIAGDDSIISKGQVELTQDIEDWDKLSDEEKKAAKTQRTVNAVLGTLDLMPVLSSARKGFKGIKAGVKAGQIGTKGGLKAGFKAGMGATKEQVGKTIASRSFKDVAKLGAKEIAKQGAKAGAKGSFSGAALGVAANAVFNGGKNWQDAAWKGAESGFMGGMMNMPFDVDAKAIKQGMDTKANIKAEIEKVKALPDMTPETRAARIDQLTQELDSMSKGNYSDDMFDVIDKEGKNVSPEDISRSGQKQVKLLEQKRNDLAGQLEKVTDPQMKENLLGNLNDIDEQIDVLKHGGTDAVLDSMGAGYSKELNAERVRQRWSQLNEERAKLGYDSLVAAGKEAEYKAPSRTYNDASKDLDTVAENGVVDYAVTNRPDYENLDQIVADPNMPAEISDKAIELAGDRADANQRLSQLMTQERASATLDDIDAKYRQDVERINAMPPARREAEMARLDSEYQTVYDDIMGQVKRDEAEVLALHKAAESIDRNSYRLLQKSNTLKNENPAHFGTVNQDVNKVAVDRLEREAHTALFNEMSGEGTRSDSSNVSKAMAEMTPEQIDALKNTPEGKRLGAIVVDDIFTNKSYMKWADSRTNYDNHTMALEFSSPSSVLTKAFGEKGTELFGRILKHFGLNSQENLRDSLELIKVKKLIGRNKDANNMVVDIVEGKVVDLTKVAPQQAEAANIVQELLGRAKRQVQKLAYDESINSFKTRTTNKDFKFTGEELEILARRDGIKFADARKNYSEMAHFKRSDVDYIAAYKSNHSTLENYFPHLFTKEEAKRMAGYSNKNVTGEVKFNNMLRRTANLDDYSRDVVGVMSEYLSALNRKTYLEPVLRELDDVKLYLKTTGAGGEALYEWANAYQGQIKSNKTSAFGENVNKMIDYFISKHNPNDARIGKNHYRTSLAIQRQVNAMAMLGLSPRNALLQLGQFGQAIGNLGVKDMTIGTYNYIKNMSNPSTRAAYRQLLDNNGVTNAGFVREAFSQLQMDGVKLNAKNTWEKFGDILTYMTSKTDEFARGSTFEASYRQHLKAGKSRQVAETLAAADAARFNFLTSKVDMPIKLNKDGVRSATQFLSFEYKAAEGLKNLGIKTFTNPKTGKIGINPQQLGRVIQMVGFYTVLAEGMYHLAGVERNSQIPFSSFFEDGEMPRSPLVRLVMGDGKGDKGLIQTMLEQPNGKNEYEKEKDLEKKMEYLVDTFIKNVVPASAQARKSIEGYQSSQGDGVYEKDGKVKFIQGVDDWSKVQSTIFGKYATKEGREWIKKDFPSLTEKQSDIVKKQTSRSGKQRAYDFFAGFKDIQSKQGLTSSIKEIVHSQPARAKRLASEHNRKIDEAVKKYQNKYGEMTAYEKDYLKKQYYISVENFENTKK